MHFTLVKIYDIFFEVRNAALWLGLPKTLLLILKKGFGS